MRRFSCFAAAALVVASPASAGFLPDSQPTLYQLAGSPERWKISASSRVRFEAVDGQVRPGFDDSSQLISLRTTLFAEHDFGGVRVGGEIRDARVYIEGDRTPLSTSEVNTLEPVQAYVAADLGDVLGSGSTTRLQAGRMVISLGSTRLVTSEEFRNTANGYTGVRADYRSKGGVAATLIWTLPQVRLPLDRASIGRNSFALDRESPDLMLFGGIVTAPLRFAWGSLDTAYFGLLERDGAALPTLDRRLHTFDARLFRDPVPGKLDWEFEGAWQIGTISASAARNAASRDVRAYFYHLEIGYTWAGPWAPRLSFEYDHATGTRATGSYGRFDTLFGGRRADFSPSGIYNEINRANIASPGLRLEVAPDKRLDGQVEARILLLPERTDGFATTNVRDPLGRSGTYAGEQYDFRLRYWLIPRALRFELDFDYLRKGRFLTAAPNAPRNGDTRFVAVSLLATY